MSTVRQGGRQHKGVAGESSMTKSERLLFLIDLLKTRGRVGREEVVEACGISERTLYRDLRSLARMKVPVVSDGEYVLKTERSSLSDFDRLSEAELQRFSRILDTFISAIRWGVPLVISTVGERRDGGAHHLPRGLKFKRAGLHLCVLQYPSKRTIEIPLTRITRVTAVLGGSPERAESRSTE